MKNSLIAACLLVAAPAVAQTPPPVVQPGRPGMMMGDKVQTRAEVTIRIQRAFAMVDTNHDGVLDQAELAAASSKWEGAATGGSGAAPYMPMDRNAMFDMIDANHDGSLSRDEFARAPMHHGGGMGRDHDGDGQPDRRDGKGKGGMGAKGMGGGMARLWGMADANHDGRVTLQEANAAALQRFDSMDANHDGQVTPEERAAGRGMMRGQ
ncbi:MAG: EF-hand domain-containing protein [Sphingomicrobium sp.]